MKKVGIYSGTFDPIHDGHVAFAREAIEECGLDKVFFLVEPKPRRKQGVKAFEHRVRMVQLAIADDPKLGSIVLDQQRFTPRDTFPLLSRRFEGAELYMLMGDDSLNHFAGSDWPHIEYLVENISFAIGLRRHSRKEAEKLIKLLQDAHGWRMKYKLFKASKPECSSTDIKRLISQGKDSQGLHTTVLEYIRKHRLYASASDSGSK